MQSCSVSEGLSEAGPLATAPFHITELLWVDKRPSAKVFQGSFSSAFYFHTSRYLGDFQGLQAGFPCQRVLTVCFFTEALGPHPFQGQTLLAS